MQTLRTAILQHTTAAGSHFDWLFENPDHPLGPLCAARVCHPTRIWDHISSLLLTPLSSHRRIYLAYQGPLTARRGQVRRLDQGFVFPLLWQPARQLLEIQTRFCHLRLDLRPLTPPPPQSPTPQPWQPQPSHSTRRYRAIILPAV